MTVLTSLVSRNTKLFFKDKGMFLTALITPIILLVLFVTFLGNVYRDSILSALPEGMTIADELINGCVGGWLFSSLLAVSCVTVAFCSNLIMVQDKVTGACRDLTIAPIRKSTLGLSYFLSTAATTLIICLIALCACFVYLACVGWYLSAADILLTLLDVVLLVLFGTALSSVIDFFLSTQGQISAVGAIVSAGYGFICGAYMPIAQFSKGIQTFMGFLPGTYGTSLLHNHLMRGAIAELETQGYPVEFTNALRDTFDTNLYFFDAKVAIPTMYLIVGVTVVVLVAVFLLLNKLKKTDD